LHCLRKIAKVLGNEDFFAGLMESIMLEKIFLDRETDILSKFKLEILNQVVTNVPQLLPLVQSKMLTRIKEIVGTSAAAE